MTLKLALLGHAAVLLEDASGRRLMLDPYEAGGLNGAIAYERLEVRVDEVACSHEHADHSARHELPGAPRYWPGEVSREQSGWFELRRVKLEHDEYGGRRFGGEVDALVIALGGVTLVHLSDVGHSPRPGDIEAIGPVDIVCVPVGGFYTVGAAQAREWCERLGARVWVPIHHATSRCGLELAELEDFLALTAEVKRYDEGEGVSMWRVEETSPPAVLCLPLWGLSKRGEEELLSLAVTFCASKPAP